MTPIRADLGLVVVNIASYVRYVHRHKSKIGEIGRDR